VNPVNLYNKLNDWNFIDFDNNPYSKALRFKTGAQIKYFNIEYDYKLMFELDDIIKNGRQILLRKARMNLKSAVDNLDNEIDKK
jgi:hypothetical protein